MLHDGERWEREQLMEAPECYRHGTSDAPSIRKWAAQAHDGPAGGEMASSLTFVASTEDEDRHGDIILQGGWKLDAYLKNPVFLWAHHYSQPAIGKALDVWTEPRRLLAAIRFAPTEFAQQIASLYQGGYQKGVSVGFRPLEFEMRRDAKTGHVLGINFISQELLEISAAPVPANQNALRKGLNGAAMEGEQFPSWEAPDPELEGVLEVIRQLNPTNTRRRGCL